MMLKESILAGLSEILEVPVTANTVLGETAPWDSLGIVCTIALIDEKAGREVSGEQLIACKTVADILALAVTT